MRGVSTLFCSHVTQTGGRPTHDTRQQNYLSMTRLISAAIAAALLVATAQAQTTPAPAQTPPAQTQPPSTQAQPAQPEPGKSRLKPGMILENPGSGRITDRPLNQPAPSATPPKPTSSDPLAGLKVERFEVTGNTSVASDTIRVYLGVVPGEPYDPASIQRNFLNLWQTGLFDDISVDSDRVDAGVLVKVTVKERPRIGSVEYRGNKDLATNKITEALEKDKIDLHVGSTLDQTLINRAAESIKHAYVENGYEDPSVAASTEELTGDATEKKIVFNINEGVKAKVSAIEFSGNKHFTSRRLRSVMKEVKTNNIISWIRKKNLYIPSKLDEDLENLKNYYEDYGYFNVRFDDPQIVTLGKNTKKPHVKILITVHEGTVYRMGDVAISGNTVFTNQQIIGDWPVKKGEVIRRKPIQDRLDAFGDAYRIRGYIYSYVNPEYVQKDNNIIDVKVQVFEGDQFHLGRLEFTGNTNTKDKVLRREIFLQEGQIMDMETFKQSLYKLGQLGYFKVTDNPDLKVNQDKKTVDVTVKGNEEGKNDVQFGGGYSEGGGAFVQAQFQTRNFLGEGENLGLSFQQGTRTHLFSISYADPWFLDTPNSLGASIYNSDTRLPASVGYESRTKGGSISYGYRLRRFDSLSFVLGHALSKVHYEFTTAPDANGNIPVATITDYSFRTSTIVPAYQFNSLDNPFDTTRGSKYSLALAYSGGLLGGTVHEFKPTINFTRFFKLSRKSTVSFNLETGRIFPLDKNCSNTYEEWVAKNNTLCVPETERFLVGGEYSIRGFKFGTLGPTETIAGVSRPAGGYKYHVANLEYIFHINDPLRLVFFVDAGQGYGYHDPWKLSQTRYSAGTELRIFLPVFQFPLRFIYAFNVRPQRSCSSTITTNCDQFESFQFTIGNTY
jgi:outer membrane protein insertion porin family